jgi:hypothetical protein
MGLLRGCESDFDFVLCDFARGVSKCLVICLVCCDVFKDRGFAFVAIELYIGSNVMVIVFIVGIVSKLTRCAL